MNWLLKVVDGPAKGAEADLATGTRVSFGTAETCDLVVNDPTVASVAFVLDVADDRVSLINADGTFDPLEPFEIRVFGKTVVAVGPAEGAWGPLHRVERHLFAPSPASPPASVPTPPSPSPSPSPSVSPAASVASVPPRAAAPVPPPERPKFVPVSQTARHDGSRSNRGIGCLFVILLLLSAGGALWWFWTDVVTRCPAVGTLVSQTKACACAAGARLWTGCVRAKEPEVVRNEISPALPLAVIARQYRLRLTQEAGVPVVSGSFARRTERLAVEALARASDASVRLELSDAGGEAPAPSGAPLPADAPSVAGILMTPYPCVVTADGQRLVEGARFGAATIVKIEAEGFVFREGESEREWRP